MNQSKNNQPNNYETLKLAGLVINGQWEVTNVGIPKGAALEILPLVSRKQRVMLRTCLELFSSVGLTEITK